MLGVANVALHWSQELLADYHAAVSAPGRASAGATAMRQRMSLNALLYRLGFDGYTSTGDPCTLHALRTHPPLSLRLYLLQRQIPP